MTAISFRRVLSSSSIFAYFKKMDQRIYIKIRNITCKLCATCAKQSVRKARTCGRTKIGFCTMITPLLIHRCLCANFWPKNNTIMLPQPPYSSDLAPCDLFLFPKLKRQKSKTSQNTSKQNSCQKLIEHSK